MRPTCSCVRSRESMQTTFGVIEIVGVASLAVRIVLGSIVLQGETCTRYRLDDREKNSRPRQRGSWQKRRQMKIGDRVKIIQGRAYLRPSSRIGQEAVIAWLYPPSSNPTALHAVVRFADGLEWACYEDEMESVPAE